MNDFRHLFLNLSKVAASCLRIGLSSFTTVIQMFVLHIFAFNKRANRSEGNANFPPSSHNLSFLALPRLLHSLAKWLTHADGKTPTRENQLLGNAAGSPSSHRTPERVSYIVLQHHRSSHRLARDMGSVPSQAKKYRPSSCNGRYQRQHMVLSGSPVNRSSCKTSVRTGRARGSNPHCDGAQFAPIVL